MVDGREHGSTDASRRRLKWVTLVCLAISGLMFALDGRDKGDWLSLVPPGSAFAGLFASLLAQFAGKDAWARVTFVGAVGGSGSLALMLGAGLDGGHVFILLVACISAASFLGAGASRAWIGGASLVLVAVAGMRWMGMTSRISALPTEAVTAMALGCSLVCAWVIGAQSWDRPRVFGELEQAFSDLARIRASRDEHELLVKGLRGLRTTWIVTLDIESGRVLHAVGDLVNLGLKGPQDTLSIADLVALFGTAEPEHCRAILMGESRSSSHFLKTESGMWLQVQTSRQWAMDSGLHPILLQHRPLTPEMEALIAERRTEEARSANMAAIGQLSGPNSAHIASRGALTHVWSFKARGYRG